LQNSLFNVEMMADPTPAEHLPAADLDTLRLRAGMLKQVREFFDERGFLEVETPLLSADVVVDRHLDPLPVTLPADVRQPDVGRPMWLQTSPEFAMKRLLAAGAGAIFQVTKAFRAGETGRLHNPEFTLVEWYRAGDGYPQGMQLLSDLCATLLGRGPANLLSYAEAFSTYAGVDPHMADVEELFAAARINDVVTPLDFSANDRDAWLDLLLTDLVEPHLGRSQPTILYDYPASQAALARVRDADPPVAERFELYVDGIELANGYHELTDAEELRRRNRAANAARAADGKPPLPEDSRLLEAMQSGLPAAVGVALGFDRVVMLAAGARSIAEVMAFPIDRA